MDTLDVDFLSIQYNTFHKFIGCDVCRGEHWAPLMNVLLIMTLAQTSELTWTTLTSRKLASIAETFHRP